MQAVIPRLLVSTGLGPTASGDGEVVLADGTIVEANADTNADLWRALKGGTSNFGEYKKDHISHPRGCFENPPRTLDLPTLPEADLETQGIVTRFDIETHPETKARYTVQLYSPADYVNINAATLAVQEQMERDPKVNIFTNFNQAFVAVFHMYADCCPPPEANQPSAFEPFDRLSSKINTPLPQTDGNVFSFVQVLSQMGHVPHPLK